MRIPKLEKYKTIADQVRIDDHFKMAGMKCKVESNRENAFGNRIINFTVLDDGPGDRLFTMIVPAGTPMDVRRLNE